MTDQDGAGEPPAKTSPDVPESLRVNVPTDEKVQDPKQETTNGDEKQTVESSKDEPTKIPPVVSSQPTASSKTDDVDKESKEREEREKWEESRKKLPRKAAVKWSDYEHFKNRYTPEEGLEIIEVLYGHPDLGGEIAREKARRNSKRAIASRKAPAADNRWIQRVRIESAILIPLLAHLTSCDGVINDWPSDRPRVFFRPFMTFYHSFPLVKKCFEILEGQGLGGHTTDFDLRSPVVASNARPAEPDLIVAENGTDRSSIIDSSVGTDVLEFLVASMDPTIALQHLRVYVEFMERNIIPMWDEAAKTSKQRARFCDLPMFFRPGELLYTTHGKSTPTPTSKTAAQNKSSEKRAVQNIFKLVSVHMSEMEEPEPSDWRSAGRTLYVRAYHVDFDGDTYGPDDAFMYINGYAGEKDIRSLYVYPLRYDKDRRKIEAELCERGKRFLPLVRERHCYYDGPSLLFNKYGDNPADSDLNSEYIDGEIMIDFKEGSRANSDLTGSVDSAYNMGAFRWYDLTDPIEIKFWDGPGRLKLLGESRDITQTDEDFRKQYELSMLKRDYFVKAYDEKEPWLREYTTDLSSHFDNEKYILLPPRLIAYSFRARKFFMADIDYISTITTTKHSFRDLRIDPDHKRMVKSLVRSHFEKQDMRRQATSANLDQDFIRGKGAGLIILLHGVPGVGKTTTAEAVALHNRKPLFTITSGDLGFTPAQVEKALQETFRLAQIWDCVLLLDEADLFLSRREVEDLERNALVSVFLRVLEYYNGILFLTTNRVGTIDEAFKSRIHVSLYYPPLDKQQTVDIFEVNLRRLHEIEAAKTASRLDYTPLEVDDGSIIKFAKRHFENHAPSQRWNGRQIRNAFQVAYSLAQFNMEKKNPDDSDDDFPQAAQDNGGKSSTSYRRSRLDSKQFKKVSQSVERFDQYLFKTRGADADTARNHRLRNDNYHDAREDDRRSAGIDYQNAQRRHPLPELVRTPSGRSPVFDLPDSRDNDWGSAGPDYQSSQRLHALPELARSHSGRGPPFDARVPSPRIPPRDVSDDEDDEDDSDSDGSSGGSEYEKYKRGSASNPARHPLVSSHSTPAVTKIKGSRDRHYRQKASGDALSPDDTGYGRGGSISSGRADSYGRGGY